MNVLELCTSTFSRFLVRPHHVVTLEFTSESSNVLYSNIAVSLHGRESSVVVLMCKPMYFLYYIPASEGRWHLSLRLQLHNFCDLFSVWKPKRGPSRWHRAILSQVQGFPRYTERGQVPKIDRTRSLLFTGILQPIPYSLRENGFLCLLAEKWRFFHLASL